METPRSQFLMGIANQSELISIKALDDLAFGVHKGITLDELIEIMEHGKVLTFKSPDGKLIGESQIITSPMSLYPGLSPDEAFVYGTAIHPDYQQQDLSKELYAGQEIVAKEAGKKKISSTIRVENMKSLRARFKRGYLAVAYFPNYYGPVNEDGARFKMEKKLDGTEAKFNPQELSRLVMDKTIPILDYSDSTISSEKLALPVIGGDEVFFPAHKILPKIFNLNYKGIGLIRPDEYGAETAESLLVFERSV